MVGANGRRVVMLGAPGSGKGTQAEQLAQRLGIPAISTGEMLRSAVEEETALGHRVSDVMARGELVSDELMAEVVRDRLAQPDARAGFVLDGYPRTEPQADTLDRILSDQGVELDHVIFLDVPERELMERALARQRADDLAEILEERLRVYTGKTAPLIERYGSRSLIRHIDGNRPVAAVAEELSRLFS